MMVSNQLKIKGNNPLPPLQHMTQSLKCDTRHVVFFMKGTDFILDVGKITFFLSTVDEPHDRVI